MKQGSLFVVATPIGNLDDLSPRARQVLADVDVVAAEDTRHSGRLLSHFGIDTPLLPLHEHNERDAVAGLLARIREGASIALVSDAGTPLVSDPGFRLVREARRNGIEVSPLPGPSAAVAALSVSGLATDRYCFEGFLPAKAGPRRERLRALQTEGRTMIFFAAVHRLAATLGDMAQAFGEGRPAFLARELTKLHEQCVAAPLGELLERLRDGRITGKGEIVVVVGGGEAAAPAAAALSVDRLLTVLAGLLPGRQAAAVVAEACGLPRNQVYRRMLALTREDPGGDG